MKRLRRRVDNSQNIGTLNNTSSKTLTFDRKTFFECSNRMKRLVPTLSRRQTNPNATSELNVSSTQVDPERSTLSEDEDDDHSLSLVPERELKPTTTASSPATNVEALGLGSDDKQTTYAVVLPHRTHPGSLMLTRDHSSKLDSNEFKMRTFVTLPRNMETSIVDAGIPSTATLPPTTSPSRAQQRHHAGRRLWMKPVSHFVSFMSSIGDNIHITSYPTP